MAGSSRAGRRGAAAGKGAPRVERHAPPPRTQKHAGGGGGARDREYVAAAFSPPASPARATAASAQREGEPPLFVPPSLPPRVDGPVEGELLLSVPAVLWRDAGAAGGDAALRPCVRALFWGQGAGERGGTLYRPQPVEGEEQLMAALEETSREADAGGRRAFHTVAFPVRAPAGTLAQYLYDARELSIKLRDSTGRRELGEAALPLERLAAVLAAGAGQPAEAAVLAVTRGGGAPVADLAVAIAFRAAGQAASGPWERRHEQQPHRQREQQQQQQQHQSQPRSPRGGGVTGDDPKSLLATLRRRAERLRHDMGAAIVGAAAARDPLPAQPQQLLPHPRSPPQSPRGAAGLRPLGASSFAYELALDPETAMLYEQAVGALSSPRNGPSRAAAAAASASGPEAGPATQGRGGRRGRGSRKPMPTAMVAVYVRVRQAHLRRPVPAFVAFQVLADSPRQSSAVVRGTAHPSFDMADRTLRMLSHRLVDHLGRSLLVVEVWDVGGGGGGADVGGEGNLVGLVKVPLEPVADRLREVGERVRARNERESGGGGGGMHRSPRAPPREEELADFAELICINGDFAVVDPYTGAEAGTVNLMVAAGTQRQVRSLHQMEAAATHLSRVFRDRRDRASRRARGAASPGPGPAGGSPGTKKGEGGGGALSALFGAGGAADMGDIVRQAREASGAGHRPDADLEVLVDDVRLPAGRDVPAGEIFVAYRPPGSDEPMLTVPRDTASAGPASDTSGRWLPVDHRGSVPLTLLPAVTRVLESVPLRLEVWLRKSAAGSRDDRGPAEVLLGVADVSLAELAGTAREPLTVRGLFAVRRVAPAAAAKSPRASPRSPRSPRASSAATLRVRASFTLRRRARDGPAPGHVTGKAGLGSDEPEPSAGLAASARRLRQRLEREESEWRDRVAALRAARSARGAAAPRSPAASLPPPPSPPRSPPREQPLRVRVTRLKGAAGERAGGKASRPPRVLVALGSASGGGADGPTDNIPVPGEATLVVPAEGRARDALRSRAVIVSVLDGQRLVGEAAVGLDPLTRGFRDIGGWYHVEGPSGEERGFVRVEVRPAGGQNDRHSSGGDDDQVQSPQRLGRMDAERRQSWARVHDSVRSLTRATGRLESADRTSMPRARVLNRRPRASQSQAAARPFSPVARPPRPGQEPRQQQQRQQQHRRRRSAVPVFTRFEASPVKEAAVAAAATGSPSRTFSVPAGEGGDVSLRFQDHGDRIDVRVSVSPRSPRGRSPRDRVASVSETMARSMRRQPRSRSPSPPRSPAPRARSPSPPRSPPPPPRAAGLPPRAPRSPSGRGRSPSRRATPAPVSPAFHDRLARFSALARQTELGYVGGNDWPVRASRGGAAAL